MKLEMALIVAYMLLTYLAIALAMPALAVVALALLAVIVLYKPLRRGALWAYVAVAALLALLASAPAQRWAPIALFLPPVFINGGLAWLFGHTLLSGKTPLIARIVRLLHRHDEVRDPAVWDYARSVTKCWTALFCFNAALCLVLAAFAAPNGLLAALGHPPRVTIPSSYWSFYSEIGCYALFGLMFLVEYAYRRRRFPWQPYRNFLDFLRQAAGIGPALAAELWSGEPSPPER